MKWAARIVLFAAVMAGAESLKTAPPDLIELKNADLLTKKPLVIAREGVYVCRNGFDMYVRTKETKDAIVKAAPLNSMRIISDASNKVYIVCVSIDQ